MVKHYFLADMLMLGYLCLQAYFILGFVSFFSNHVYVFLMQMLFPILGLIILILPVHIFHTSKEHREERCK